MCPRCHNLARADFDEFVMRDQMGNVRFANQMLPSGRGWCVFRPLPRKFKNRRRDWFPSPCYAKADAAIIKSSRVAAARRWIPCNPLLTHTMQVEDAVLARRGLS